MLALLCAAMLAAAAEGASTPRKGSAFQSLLEGLRYVWQDPTVLALMLAPGDPGLPDHAVHPAAADLRAGHPARPGRRAWAR